MRLELLTADLDGNKITEHLAQAEAGAWEAFTGGLTRLASYLA